MVRITEDLIRKRAEHNNSEIFSLEELSLHQQDLEKIEHIQKWCKELKILYLQNNLIGKIENVGRLKKLEYLNLALNNIERVENLQNCESLKKLDLTVNFVGELTSIESLKNNIFLEDLYLTGNPCTQYTGYKEFVIAALPQLKWIDGHEIEKSERIKAMQEIDDLRKTIMEQETAYLEKRAHEKSENQTSVDCENTDEELNEDEKRKKEEEFWSEKVDFTPETRTSIQNKLRENRENTQESKFSDPNVKKRNRRLFNDTGQPLNVNEAKIDFSITESDDEQYIILDVACWKYLDTSLIDVDVEPLYVRVTMKGSVLQLVLFDEVKVDASTAQRSQTTGHLIVTMPKLNPSTPHPALRPTGNRQMTSPSGSNSLKEEVKGKGEFLDVKQSEEFMDKLAGITRNQSVSGRREKEERKNSADFVDDLQVPPLI